MPPRFENVGETGFRLGACDCYVTADEKIHIQTGCWMHDDTIPISPPKKREIMDDCEEDPSSEVDY